MNVGATEAVAGAAAEEELPPKLNGEAPPAAGAPAPNEKEGVTAPEPGAGEVGAGDGDAEGAPKVNAGGLDGLVVAPPKNELVAAAGEGAPKGEAGGLVSFFSVEVGAPKVKPAEEGAVEPNKEAPVAGAVLPPDDTPPNENGAGAAAGSASSSMPLSPASSVTDAGADGGFSVPKVGLGAESFFSSACGVAGVVPKVKVGVVVVGGFAAAPKENGAGLSLSSEAFEAGAPKENGEAVVGAASDFAAAAVVPNANGDLSGCDQARRRRTRFGVRFAFDPLYIPPE